jgi:hypothetical protein
VLISDGGGEFPVQGRAKKVWPLQAIRVASVVDRQVRAQRSSNAIDAFKDGRQLGTYWAIRTEMVTSVEVV